MHHYVLLQALGDNLISLSALSSLTGRVNVIGTKQTANVLGLIDLNHKFSVDILFDDIPSFYDLKNNSIIRVFRDILIFRKYIKRNNISNLFFEKSDFRIFFLTFGLNVKIKKVCKNNNVYIDRYSSFSESIFTVDRLKTCSKENYKIKNIVISPASRLAEKDITYYQLSKIIYTLKEYNICISLVDYDKKYKKFAIDVDCYLDSTTLKDVKEIIINCDLFIGPDSFLIHLAYFYNKLSITIFNIDSDRYFLTPCSLIYKDYIPPLPNDDFNDEFNKTMSLLNLEV
jgi:hypothetical protein